MREFLEIVKALLTEGKVLRIDGHDGKFNVWINPSHREIVELVKRYDLRGIATPNELFVWDSGEQTHFGMEDILTREFGYQLNPETTANMVFTEPYGDFSSYNLDDDVDWEDAPESPDLKIGSNNLSGYHYPPVTRAIGVRT